MPRKKGPDERLGYLEKNDAVAWDSLLFSLKHAHYCIHLQMILHKMCNFYIKTRVLFHKIGANQEQTPGNRL